MNFLPLVALIPSIVFFIETAQAPSYPDPLKGIYLTSYTVSNQQGAKLVDDWKAVGGNMIVFDIQDSGGHLAYPSNLASSFDLKNRGTKIADLATTIKSLHEKGFYVVARYVLFKNSFLARAKPEWTIKRKGTGRTFVSRDGPIWLDPGNPELKEYLIDVGREIAFAGADEIQFDYVRFPEGGKGGYVGYTFTGSDAMTRDQALTSFVAEISESLHAMGVKTSVDVFGIVVWDNVSWKVIGQNISELAKHVDAIYPMPYPSHFGPGWGGHRNPGDEPYFFVQETTKKFLEQTAGTKVKIRPWLQGFALRARSFGPNYIKEQVRALNDIGMQEFSVWNAANNYWATLKAFK